MRGHLHTDGGARGNPGPAGIGVVLVDESGRALGEIARSIGDATNNVAEYTALIEGLKLALEKGVTDVVVNCDSQLVVSQVRGEWKVKNDQLRGLVAEARRRLRQFDSSEVRHVRRGDNADADKLVNQALDRAELDAELGPEWEPPDEAEPDPRAPGPGQGSLFS